MDGRVHPHPDPHPLFPSFQNAVVQRNIAGGTSRPTPSRSPVFTDRRANRVKWNGSAEVEHQGGRPVMLGSYQAAPLSVEARGESRVLGPSLEAGRGACLPGFTPA